MSTRTLYLIRHGKAEDHSFSRSDFDRNLVTKGHERSKWIGLKLQQQLTNNNTLVISSSANRALQTAEIFCDLLSFPKNKIQIEKSIYEAYFLEILKVINKVPNDIETVIIFGHNPGLSDLTNYLCDSCINLNTSHVAKILVPENFNFSEISGSTCHLETVITE